MDHAELLAWQEGASCRAEGVAFQTVRKLAASPGLVFFLSSFLETEMLQWTSVLRLHEENHANLSNVLIASVQTILPRVLGSAWDLPGIRGKAPEPG